ncbi:MAG: RimK family alpha-L-glutamate ligase [Desulfurococcaceae archaeon]
MKVAIIHYRSTPPPSALELSKAVEELGGTPQYYRISELDAIMGPSGVKVMRGPEEVDADCALLRSFGATTNYELLTKRLGVLEAMASRIPVINDPERAFVARDKWRGLLRLLRAGLPVPTTMVTENPRSAMRFVESNGAVVYKPISGSLGLGSALLLDPDLAFQTTRNLIGIGMPSYYQVFLRKPGYDYRVFVVGGRPIGGMRRRVASGWKTNIAQGAMGEKVSEEEEPAPFELAIKATEVLGLDYAGVDVALDVETSKYYILEVNVFPQWKGLMQATGVNVPMEIVKYAVERVRK